MNFLQWSTGDNCLFTCNYVKAQNTNLTMVLCKRVHLLAKFLPTHLISWLCHEFTEAFLAKGLIIFWCVCGEGIIYSKIIWSLINFNFLDQKSLTMSFFFIMCHLSSCELHIKYKSFICCCTNEEECFHGDDLPSLMFAVSMGQTEELYLSCFTLLGESQNVTTACNYTSVKYKFPNNTLS